MCKVNRGRYISRPLRSSSLKVSERVSKDCGQIAKPSSSPCSPTPERNEATNGSRNESTGSSRCCRSRRGEGRGRSRRGRRMISPDRQPIVLPVPGLSWPPGLMNLEISNPKYDFSRKASRQTKTKTCLTPASLSGPRTISPSSRFVVPSGLADIITCVLYNIRVMIRNGLEG